MRWCLYPARESQGRFIKSWRSTSYFLRLLITICTWMLAEAFTATCMKRKTTPFSVALVHMQRDDMSDSGRIFQNMFHYPSWQKVWQMPKTYTPEILQPYETLYLNKTTTRRISDCLKISSPICDTIICNNKLNHVVSRYFLEAITLKLTELSVLWVRVTVQSVLYSVLNFNNYVQYAQCFIDKVPLRV